MTGPFWKLTRWLFVLCLLVLGLNWGGCRGPEAVYSEIPGAAHSRTSCVFQRELVRVYFGGGLHTTVHEQRINEDGTLTLPDVGVVIVTNKTVGELQNELTALYRKYYKNLDVRVVPEGRIYYVGGEVQSRGPKEYVGKTTVSMAIQAAGDFTKFANKKKVVLIRPNDRRETVNIVKAATNPSLDLPVYPGDAIFVKQRGYWFQKVPNVRWEGLSEADY